MAGICLELSKALSATRRARDEARQVIYDRCLPLVQELQRNALPPLPVRQITPLIHEFHWHFRCLAGLNPAGVGSDEEHEAWARSSLEQLQEAVPVAVE